jgi:hypothetical protein
LDLPRSRLRFRSNRSEISRALIGRFAGLAKGAKVFCFFPLTVERVPLLCAPRLLREERSGRRECGGFFRFGKVWLGSVELLGWRFLEQPKERENGEKENFLQNLV